MLREINPKTHAVIDLRSCAEISGAVAVDLDTGEVRTKRRTYMDEFVEETARMPDGVRVVRR